jgi:hypothetical protein
MRAHRFGKFARHSFSNADYLAFAGLAHHNGKQSKVKPARPTKNRGRDFPAAVSAIH